MDARSAAIATLLDRTTRFEGLPVDSETLGLLHRRRQAAGHRLVDGPLRGALDAAAFETVQRAVATGGFAAGLESCVPVAGFGAILGEAVACSLEAAGREVERASEWAAFWNLLVAYFDELCDEYGSMLPLLKARIGANDLNAALRADVARRLAPEPDDPVLLRFVVEVADATFDRFRMLAGRFPPPQAARLIRAIETAYASELETAPWRFSEGRRSADVGPHLRASGSLPVWILGYTVAVDRGGARGAAALDAALAHIGDVLWLLDDLVDLEDDVGTDRWNAAFLIAGERHGEDALARLRALSPDDRIGWLGENGVPAALADRIFESLSLAVAALDRGAGRASPLARQLLATLWSFAGPAPTRASED